ncbi:hypothetical protein BX070DRAFT_50972 [Coemansia spiralis]|nr:hypothetical protein BX070DRAFT_50972 [Coemansia spiralis]
MSHSFNICIYSLYLPLYLVCLLLPALDTRIFVFSLQTLYSFHIHTDSVISLLVLLEMHMHIRTFSIYSLPFFNFLLGYVSSHITYAHICLFFHFPSFIHTLLCI